MQQRGAAVIKARKLSSAMSAAKAIADHIRQTEEEIRGDEGKEEGRREGSRKTMLTGSHLSFEATILPTNGFRKMVVQHAVLLMSPGHF